MDHETGFIAGSAGETEAATVAELATRATAPTLIDPSADYVVTVPAGDEVTVLDLDHRLDHPRRAAGVYRPATVDAFTAHVNRHFDPTTTTVWVHPVNGRIVALFNDTTPTNGAADAQQPGWRDHRSQLDLQHTPEWMFWKSKDGALVSQTEFAEHFEDGVKELVEPDAATMLELAQSFHATQAGTFRSAHRLHDGTVQVQYDETIDATAGRHQEIPVPTEFKLAIAPFLGEQPQAVTARLRYRLNSGSLRLGYRLERPDEIVRDALANIAERLTSEFTHVFLGEPAA